MHLRTLLIVVLSIGTISLAIQAQTSYKSCGYERECVPAKLCSTSEKERGGAQVFSLRFGGNICSDFEVCCIIEHKIETRIYDFSNGCGYRNINGVGAESAQFDHGCKLGEFPWMVAILHEENLNQVSWRINKCGGSLITPNVVLTCAHCVYKYPNAELLVRAGELDPRGRTESFPHQDRSVVDMVIHENFHESRLYNDIALLFTRTSFVLSSHINTICLPPAGASFTHSNCYATGWGKYQFEDSMHANVLKRVDLPMVPHDNCEQALQTTRLTKIFKLHDSFVCAGGVAGKDMCTSDGGSPLVCQMPGSVDRYYQVGLVAWGIGCGSENIPGVYASVPYLRGWIDMKLSNLGVDKSYYSA